MKKYVAMCLSVLLASSLALTGCNKEGSATDNDGNETTAGVSSETEAATDAVVEYTHDWTTEITVNPTEIEAEDVELLLNDSIYVDAIEGLSEDFILGCDISSLIAEEASGVAYYNENGEEEDLLKILAEHGVNTVRIRVWNDPYDENGNGYGGGNCDTDTAIAIGVRAAQYGISCIIDYHYSDFWADPAKQMCPKAWEDMNADEKADACFEFTLDSLSRILDAGVKVSMVQIGNETTTGIAGETNWEDICLVMKGGSAAVRALDPDILIAAHFTNPEKENAYTWFADKLETYGVDYDVFASSYYTLYHGTLENLEEVLSTIVTDYGKKVMIAEIAYPYTTKNGDSFGNSASGGDDSYSTSVQGQANMIHDVAEVMAHIGEDAIGICYWEPAWIPVDNTMDYATQSAKWEKYGSGWASSYSASYDPDDAGQYYGGSSWDNQALFDFYGRPLASLSTFAYLKSGNAAELAVDVLADTTCRFTTEEGVTLPSTVTVIMNDRSTQEIPVVWDAADSDFTQTGEYEVTGTATYNGTDYKTTCTIQYVDPGYFDPTNDAEVENLVEDMSFEAGNDAGIWTVTKDDATDEAYIIKKSSDAYDGDYSFHFYAASNPVICTCEQTITGLEPGSYTLSACISGGDAGDASQQDVHIYAITGGETYTASATLQGWLEWQYPVISNFECTDGTITFGVSINTIAKSWGNVDYFILAKTN